MGNQKKQDSPKPKNFWGGCFTVLLFITNIIFLLLFLNAHVDLNYAKGRFDAARDTINDQNKEIESLVDDIETANSRIASLKSDKEELRSEIDSLQSKIDSLSVTKITTVVIENKNCYDQYVFVDGRLASGTRPGGQTLFFVPFGSYEVQFCTYPNRTYCGTKATVKMDTKIYSMSISKHSSCP